MAYANPSASQKGKLRFLTEASKSKNNNAFALAHSPTAKAVVLCLRPHRQWRVEDRWERIMTDFREELREEAGKNASPSVAIIDSRSVKTAQKGGSEAMMLVNVSKEESSIYSELSFYLV